MTAGHSRVLLVVDGAEGGVLSAFSVEKLNVMAKARAKKLLAMLRGPCQLPLVSLARE